MTDHRPILVTGTHRSGTTWVGRMLALSSWGHYVHEPFAPMNHRSWLTRRPDERFLHHPVGHPSGFDEDLDRIVELRPPLAALLRRSRGPRDVARAVQQVGAARQAGRRGERAIIKDPFALLLAEWIHDRTDADVIVCVRHPAAFVSSVKRLQWRLDEAWLLAQPDLVRGDLAPWVPALEAAGDLDLVDHACLVWRVFNSITMRLGQDHPDWIVTRYEDLALDPVPSFRRVYGQFGLPWTNDIARDVQRLNSADNPTEVPSDRRGGVVRDSRSAVWTWRDRLSRDEIDRVRTATEDVAGSWYGSPEWWEQPTGDRGGRRPAEPRP